MSLAPADAQIQVGRCELFVSVRTAPGDAPPLLMLMGLGGNVGMWEPLRGMLDPARSTVSFDIPGTGRSAVTRRPLALASLGRLAVSLLDHLELDEVDLIGVSWGGLLAQQVALTAPRRVRRVVLANTNFGLGSVPGSPAALRKLLNTDRYRSAEGVHDAARVFGGRAREFAPGMQRHAAARLAHPPSGRGYVHQMLALTGWSSLPFLPLLRGPVLLLAGGDDPAVPVANARMMAKVLPDAELVVVKDGGHLMLFDQADEIEPVITRFLST